MRNSDGSYRICVSSGCNYAEPSDNGMASVQVMMSQFVMTADGNVSVC